MPFAALADIQLYYELHGPADAQVLVLNNGILMNAATSWIHQIDPFARLYRLLLYDCRGQGQSDHPQVGYTMEQHAADLAALLDYLEIDSANVCGISYGGEISQVFAVNYPQKTRCLILADTVCEIQPDLRLVVESWREAARMENADLFYNLTVPWNFSPGFIAAHPDLFAQTRTRYQKLDYPAIARLCEAFLQFHYSDRLGEIHCPTCILVGGADNLKGPRYAAMLKNGIPHAELHILPGAGHASCWEKPEEFNTIVLGFLAKQKP
jgi:3-oxoadipate enol-lactonase